MSLSMGICRLCGANKPLLDSHYMPKSLYRLLREDNAIIQNPILTTAKTSIQSSDQVTSRLLCSEYESLFSKHGENWVIDQCFRGPGVFKLQDTLRNASTQCKGEFFAATAIPAIDVDKIVYFAASIFWRGSAHQWVAGRDQLKGIKLGKRYEEEFAQFLLGNRPFPENAALIVTVSDNVSPVDSVSSPYGGRHGRCHTYFFHIPGIHFCLFVGRMIGSMYRDACIVRSPEHRIYWGDTNPLIQGYSLSMVAHAQPVGKLAQKYPRSAA